MPRCPASSHRLPDVPRRGGAKRERVSGVLEGRVIGSAFEQRLGHSWPRVQLWSETTEAPARGVAPLQTKRGRQAQGISKCTVEYISLVWECARRGCEPGSRVVPVRVTAGFPLLTGSVAPSLVVQHIAHIQAPVRAPHGRGSRRFPAVGPGSGGKCPVGQPLVVC